MRDARLPPLVRQLTEPLGLGRSAMSRPSQDLEPRTKSADRVVQSVCPYCAVGCGQKVFVKDEKVIQIEGDPATPISRGRRGPKGSASDQRGNSPISRGRLCPKGSASEQLVNSPTRETKVKYRAPYAKTWTELDLEQATDM